MDLTIALSHVLAFLALAFALARPSFRKQGSAVLALVAILTAVIALLGDGPRTLETMHTYAGFAGSAMEVSMVDFPTGTFTANSWHWCLPFMAFSLLWIVILSALGLKELKSPWILPLIFAWTGLATWLLEQVLAAPAVVVQPAGMDRILWPAGLALCLVAAKRASSLKALLLIVGAGAMLGRLPGALFSKYASSSEIGTILDIHTIRDIVNPMTQIQFAPRLVAGSSEQEFWLIWLPHIIILPAVYLMSLFGIAFGTYMFHKHKDEPA
jgi:hypothetical protein